MQIAKLAGVVALILLSVLAATYYVRSKTSYDQMREKLADAALAAVPFSEQDAKFLKEVRSGWLRQSEEVDGPHADGLRLAGLPPTVASLVFVFTYEVPEFSLLPQRNRRAAAIGMAQALLVTISVDGKIYVAPDERLAMVRLAPGMTYVFSDDPRGLRCEVFVDGKLLDKAAADATEADSPAPKSAESP